MFGKTEPNQHQDEKQTDPCHNLVQKMFMGEENICLYGLGSGLKIHNKSASYLLLLSFLSVFIIVHVLFFLLCTFLSCLSPKELRKITIYSISSMKVKIYQSLTLTSFFCCSVGINRVENRD